MFDEEQEVHSLLGVAQFSFATFELRQTAHSESADGLKGKQVVLTIFGSIGDCVKSRLPDVAV